MEGFGRDGHDANPFVLISKMGTALTKPLMQRMGEIFTIPEHDTENNDGNTNVVDNQFTLLEGTLDSRKGRSYKWKRRIVILKFENGGSFECYSVKESPSQMLKEMMSSRLHRQASVINETTLRDTADPRQLVLLLRTDMPWIVRDIQNDPSCFVVEIPTEDPMVIQDLTHDSEPIMPQGSFESTDIARESRSTFEHGSAFHDEESFDSFEEGTMTLSSRAKLEKDFKSARSHQRPLRLYFRCPRQGNEKTLWLRGFAKLGRLSPDPWNKHRFFGKLTQLRAATSRLRKDTFSDFNRAARSLEMEQFSPNYTLPRRRPKEESVQENLEFRVFPTYCYPHLYMTRSEMREECDLPSTKFHDLRIDEKRGDEIGTLRVEVLQCLGLPKLDKNSESDGVCYLVCGSYAFATDVIPNNNNPIWMRKSRRACIFPIFHGYARLFVGVFDHDGFTNKDDYAGRVVIDIARLRPGSCYDITLPLRLSAHVYSRRQRGAIRLRFQLDYKRQRDALLSYLPSRIKIPKRTVPNTKTTVMCTDATSFRNIVLTVHGAHPPGKFSFKQFRATLKEFNFSRRKTMQLIRRTIRETGAWVNPAISCYVFCAWMHCVYIASFGLVPAYYVTFLLLHLFRNYAYYILDGPALKGFLPPTWEEMWYALSKTKKVPIKPVMIQPSREDVTDGDKADSGKASYPYTVETHKPRGKFLFRSVGFLRSEESLMENPNSRHLEFPFSSGDIYPKVRVEEALNTKQEPKEKGSSPDQNDDGRCDPSCVDEDELTIETKSSKFTPKLLEPNDDDLSSRPSPQRLFPEETNPSKSCNDFENESLGGDMSESADFSAETEELLIAKKNGVHPRDLIPDQNIDFVVDNGGKKLTDDLIEIRENMHRLTWNLFNDKTHVIKDQDATFFGADKKSTKKKDVDQQLQRLLDVGSFSHSNPFVARAGLYMMPLVGAALSFLSVARSSFNIWTWRDPFLSFWFSIFGILLAFVLFIFPWRLFFAVAGVILVGPQNWPLRIWRESRGAPSSFQALDHGNNKKPQNTMNSQPLFKSHPQPNHRFEEIDVETINPKKIHHVVVPYSPVMYQNRFYDWPPEPEHCNVKVRPPFEGTRASASDRVDSFSGNSLQDVAASSELSDSVTVASGIQVLNSGIEGVPPVINTAREGPRRRRAGTEDSQNRSASSSGRQRCNSDSSSQVRPRSQISKDRRRRAGTEDSQNRSVSSSGRQRCNSDSSSQVRFRSQISKDKSG